MKKIPIIHLFTFLALSLSACSNNTNIAPNALKTVNDNEVERVLSSGVWKYITQDGDCENTQWQQSFYTNRFYESKGTACSVSGAFDIQAENWYSKNQVLYITNLSPNNERDILIKYGISYLDNDKLILTRGKHTYIFGK